LRAFVEAHCSDTVVVVRQQGAVDQYAHRDFVPAVDSAPTAATQLSDVWHAFTNPNSALRIACDAAGELRVVGHYTPPPDGSVIVPSMTADDYRRLARRFMQNLAPEQVATLEPTLEADAFWPAWSAMIRSLGEDVKHRWGSFRLREILSVWEQRASTAGIPNDAAEKATTALRAAYQAASSIFRMRTRAPAPAPHAPTPTRTTPAAAGTQEPPRPLRGELPLRTIIGRVIASMGDHELNLLWLPVGRVLDALDH
jgi:hypothetical protein